MNKKLYDLHIVIKSVCGKCDMNHHAGEEFYIRDMKTPAGICMGAFGSILPVASMMMFGGGYPWRDDQSRVTVACQDGANPVLFEITRIEKI